jgi:hypothetical protein
MQNLVMSSLAVAYLSANVYAIVKMRVFELARSRKQLLLYGIPFIFADCSAAPASVHITVRGQ